MIIVQLLRSQTFRKPLLSTDVTCLKNSANGQTVMHRFKMILEEWSQGNQKLMRNDMCKLIINKHENSSIGVYWNNVNGPGCKFSW